jgi:TolB-like protein/Tfp pilus assembly protein PilF
MNSHRRLSAIMFTDIVGYTTMVGQDEELAIATVRHHKATIEKLVATHEGDLIQFYGDGSLSIFPSATMALACAMAIQEAFSTKVPVPLRIGIHIGEILIKEGSIYGKGVNIASRIESLGQSGTILFSEDVYHRIRNNKTFICQLLGEFEFKNVDRPIQIYALANDGFPVPEKGNITGKLKTPPPNNGKPPSQQSGQSIAVLPFENNSSVEEQQYFVDGIADEIRSQLLSINDLKVISRSSCMFFKNKPYSLDEIGTELEVSFALEGRVQAIGQYVKVSVELSDIKKDKQIWSFPPNTHKLEDIFLLQNNIAKQVVNKLKIVLSDQEVDQLNKIPTTFQDAYKYFQNGQNLLHRGQGKIEELNKAIEQFEKAIKIDPKFSRAYVGLSDTYLEHIFWGRTAPAEVLDKAMDASLKALELDSTNGECYGTLGSINFHKFNKKEAKKFLHKAIDLSPNYLGAYIKLAWIATYEGDFDLALSLTSKAQSLDPLSTKYLGDVGHVYYYAHRFQDGIDAISQMLEEHPGDPWLLWMRGFLYSAIGQYEKAIEVYLQRPIKTNWMLAYSYGKSGHKQLALDILDIHLEKRKNKYVPGIMIAVIYMGLGDHENALKWLQTDYTDGGQGLFFWGLKRDPIFAPLRERAGFISLLNKVM